jgi:hypothetical protein
VGYFPRVADSSFDRMATRWLKRLLGWRQSKSPLAVAKEECLAEDWPWVEPACVESNDAHWVVTTGSDASNRRVRVIIKKSTGRIICKSFVRHSGSRPDR